MRTLVSLLTAAALLGGCASFSEFSPGQLANDVTTTTTVKSRLVGALGMETLTRIGVRTKDDMVYLTGTVPDEATRTRVDAIVREIAGDNRVTNELTVPGVKAAAKSR